MIRTGTLVVFAFLLASCDLYKQDEYDELVVLEAYAVANRPLPEVRLSATVPAGEAYRFDDAALDGGVVRLVRLDAAGEAERTYLYEPSPLNRGIYTPQEVDVLILPGRTYRLEISFLDRPEVLRATATVPDAFEVIGPIPESVVYQSENQLQLDISPFERTWDKRVFVFDAVALNADYENLTPFYRDLVDEAEVQIGDLERNDSGVLDAANFEVNPDGSLRLRYPWLGIAFFGDNMLIINNIDRNLTDLVQSQGAQLGEDNISPGEIPNLRYHVEGGIGVFGALSSDTVRTVVRRPD